MTTKPKNQPKSPPPNGLQEKAKSPGGRRYNNVVGRQYAKITVIGVKKDDKVYRYICHCEDCGNTSTHHFSTLTRWAKQKNPKCGRCQYRGANVRHPLYFRWLRVRQNCIEEWKQFEAYRDFVATLSKPENAQALRRVDHTIPWGPTNIFWYVPNAILYPAKTRGRSWQLKQRSLGRCCGCGELIADKKYLCGECRRRARDAKRTKSAVDERR